MPALKRFAINIFEACGGFNALQWYNRNTPLVLMYHRVIDEPFIYGLTPQAFEQQIAYIAKRFRTVSMDTLIDEIQNDAVKPYTIALTFDDGHYDFYTHAWPILNKYNLCANLYVTTNFINGECWLWPDLLKYTLLNSRVESVNFPSLGLLSLTTDGLEKTWHTLGDYCLSLISEQRLNCIREFAAAAQVSLPQTPVAPFTAVTWEQLQEMKQQGLTIGSHTVTHPILSNLTEAQITDELQLSAEMIYDKLGHNPKGICYPNGRLCDINDVVLTLAKTTGYTYGLLARNSTITKSSPFLIGRLASHSNFDYFRWTLCRRPSKQHLNYIG